MVNPSFYPTPNIQIKDPESGAVVEIKDIKTGFLTEEDFGVLFDYCCKILHATNPFSRTVDSKTFLNSVPAWLWKIKTLLNHHTIQLVDPDKQLWVIMQANSDRKIYVYEFTRINENMN